MQSRYSVQCTLTVYTVYSMSCRQYTARLPVNVVPTNSYCYRKTLEGVKNFHLLFGAIHLLEYILLINGQVAWVSRWFILKKYIVKMFLFCNCSRNLLLFYVFTTMVTLCNWWMVSFVGTIFYVWKIIWQKISNLMILDNPGRDYSRMLLFVFGFLVYWKIKPNSCAYSNTCTEKKIGRFDSTIEFCRCLQNVPFAFVK